MPNEIQFNTFITKGIEIEKSEMEKRIFTGHITAEVVDKQDEIIARDEVFRIMKTYMEINPVISDSHSNRMVGKCLSYEKSEIEGHASVKIKAEIYKHADVVLYDQVWDKIVTKEYTGFSLGGASKDRKQMVTKDGKFVMKLDNLELYEIAVCKSPANQLALIDKVNTFAKENNMLEKVQTLEDGRQIISCNSIYCSVTKDDNSNEIEGKGTNRDLDEDSDNKKFMEKLQEFVMKELVTFTKPVRGHSWEYWKEKLMRENNYSEEVANATIGSWEAADKSYNLSNKTTIQHDYMPFEKCGICGMHKSHELHGMQKKLMTEGEHGKEYDQKEEAKEKEKEIISTERNEEDNLVKSVLLALISKL